MVSDDPERSRYLLTVDGAAVGLLDYRLRENTITLVHAEIDPAHRHQGLGGELARGALADARARGLRVIPQCPFVVDFIAQHPGEYDDLL